MRLEKPPIDARLRVLTASAPLDTGRSLYTYSNDDIVAACLNILTQVIGGNNWILAPSDAPESAWRVAERLSQAEGFYDAVQHLIFGFLVGYAVVEVVWGKDYYPVLLRPIDSPLVRIERDEYGTLQKFTVYTSAGLQDLPLNRALYLIHHSRIGSADGEPLLKKVEPLVKLRAALRESIQQFAERHAIPPVMGVYPPSFSDNEINSFFEGLQRLRESKVFAVPMLVGESPQVQFLEPRTSSIEWILTAYQQAGYDIARVLLGPILTIFEAQFGTRAQAQVHYDLLMQVIRGMQRAIEESVNRLYQYICVLQGVDSQVTWRLTEPPLRSNDRLIQHLPELMSMGVLDSGDFKTIRSMLNLPE